jgi:hypothetical protein
VTCGRSLAGDARRIEWKPFAVGELFFGLSYICLFAAHYRAKVTVGLPPRRHRIALGVTLSVLLFKRSELVGVRLVSAAILVAPPALSSPFSARLAAFHRPTHKPAERQWKMWKSELSANCGISFFEVLAPHQATP